MNKQIMVVRKMKQKSLNLVIVLCSVMLIFACASTIRDWEKARKFDNIKSYQEFIDKHPESEFTAQAKSRIIELQKKEAERNKEIAEKKKKLTAVLSAYKVGVTTYNEYERDKRKGSWETGDFRIQRISDFSSGESIEMQLTETVVLEGRALCHLVFKGKDLLSGDGILVSIKFY